MGIRLKLDLARDASSGQEKNEVLMARFMEKRLSHNRWRKAQKRLLFSHGSLYLMETFFYSDPWIIKRQHKNQSLLFEIKIYKKRR